MKKILCLLALSVATILAFSSCSTETKYDSVWYTWGFEKTTTSGSSSTVISEMQTIQNAYLARLGVQTSPFNLEGTVKDSDAKVKKACAEAEADLAGQSWTNYYVFHITNINTDKKIYSKAYGTKPAE